MPPLLLPIAAIVVAPVLLYVGAGWLVTGAVLAGRAARIRSMVIGLTLVAFATSAPELVVGIVSALRRVPTVAVGNVIGANVANIGLIIGISALVAPMALARSTWRKEIPMALAVQVVLFVLCLGGVLARWEGAILILLLVAFIVIMVVTRKDADLPDATKEVDAPPPATARRFVPLIASGVAMLAGGGYLLVHGATRVAEAAGLSNLAVGASLVAFLTTVPELATSVIAARRGEGDIAVGNAVGSILFNSALVLGTTALIRPLPIADATALVKVPIMIGMLVAMMAVARTGFRVYRHEGALLLAGYIAFTIYVVLTGTGG